MNEYNGLGILVEEKESPSQEKSDNYIDDKLAATGSTRNSGSTNSNEKEMLLPPLPDEETDINYSINAVNSNTDLKSLNMINSIATTNNDDVNTFESLLSKDDESRRDSDYSDFFNQNSDYSNYELDSPSLNIDPSYQLFPAVGNGTKENTNSSNNNNNCNTNGSKHNSTSLNTSPLKRFKSLKNGIRKLSLSSGNNLSKNSSNSLPAPNRPILNPLQIDTNTSSQESNNSTLASMESITSQSNHISTYSINRSKRSRTLSNSNSALTPLTPPLTSPIITLSENLSTSKKNLSTIEQNYFESLNLKSMASLDPLTRMENIQHEKISLIEEIKESNELIDYSIFLVQQKKSIIDAFELTKSRLIKSGWCSEHDLNNLQLQQDSSLCQIDTKLLQIEERLNKEFNMSLLSSNKPFEKSTIARSVSTERSELQISPSLKVLESRCFSFTQIQ